MLSRRKFLKDAVQGGFALGCSAFVTGDSPEKSFSDRIKMVIPLQFDDARSFTEGLGCVKVQERYGYINETGTFVIKPQFLAGTPFAMGFAAVNFEDGSWGYINWMGDIVNKEPWDPHSEYERRQNEEYKGLNEGLKTCWCEERKRYGYCNFPDYEWVIKPRFEDAIFFSEGLAAVKIGSLWGFIDKTGTVEIAPKFSEARCFHEGVVAVAIDGKWGYIDKGGTLLTPLQFDEGRTFSEGLAPVKVGDKWGYVGWI